jgi:hypothetical protein
MLSGPMFSCPLRAHLKSSSAQNRAQFEFNSNSDKVGRNAWALRPATGSDDPAKFGHGAPALDRITRQDGLGPQSSKNFLDDAEKLFLKSRFDPREPWAYRPGITGEKVAPGKETMTTFRSITFRIALVTFVVLAVDLMREWAAPYFDSAT